jgi:hypothetical protein
MSRKEKSGDNTEFSIMPQYHGKFSIMCHVMSAAEHLMLMDTECGLLETGACVWPSHPLRHPPTAT